MSKSEGKKRSVSQLIGQIGESLFAAWAGARHLVPQKVTDDIGIDYFCQVLHPTNAGIEHVTGTTLAVAVRSISGRRKRIKLSRVDAENILRTEAPFCLAGVDVGAKQIYYKFLDGHFIKLLFEFLRSNNDSTSILLEEMGNDAAQFDTILTRIRRTVVQRTLLMLKAELGVSSVIPEGKLYVRHDSKGSLAIVHAPWITSMFEVSPDKQVEVSTKFFEKGLLPGTNEEGVRLYREIEKLSDIAEKVLLAGVSAQEVEIIVRSNDQNASSRFVIRRIGDETAHISEAGLILVFSASREQEGQHVHHMRLSITKDSASDLSLDSTRNFLRLLKSDSIFVKDGKLWLDIAYWPSLKNIGYSIAAIEKVFKFLNKDFAGVYLKDVLEEETLNTVAFLEAIITNKHSGHIIPGFVLGPSAERKVKEDDPGWRKGQYRIPVVANFIDKGIIVWIEGDCHVFADDGLITGFRPLNITGWDYEWYTKRFEKSNEPEAWVHDEWPAIKIVSVYDKKSFTFTSGIKHEVGGDIWFDEEP